jgi:uncharacterized OsmC-like protein
MGALRVETRHVRSGQQFITDAPPDNNGRGEAFSPTDLVATALVNCLLTVMGIKAISWEKDLHEATATVVKHMGSGPRRIVQLDVEVRIKNTYTAEERDTLEKIAYTCPVAKSLHPDIKQHIQITWF